MNFDQELKSMAHTYKSQGYHVLLRPSDEALPTFAQGFKVEILAKRGDEGVLVAVKMDRDQLAADDNLTRYAKITGTQPGWRFDMVTLEPVRRGPKDFNNAADISEADIEKTFQDAQRLVESGFLNPAVITAWAGSEAAMRRKLRAAGERADWESSPRDLFNELFSNGVLAREELDKLETLYRVRNQIAHGFLAPLASEGGAVQFLTEIGRRLVQEAKTSASLVP